MSQLEALNLLVALLAAPEAHAPARGYGQDGQPAADVRRRVAVFFGHRHELARLDLAAEGLLLDAAPRGDVEPAERVSRRRDERGGLLSPHYELDDIRVHALAYFKCRAGLDRDGFERRVGRRRAGPGLDLGQVEDAQLLLVAARGDHVARVGRVGYGTDDVLVLQRVQQLARVGVPDLAAGSGQWAERDLRDKRGVLWSKTVGILTR